MIPDIINGSLELIAAAFGLYNCKVLHRDKRVQGVSLLPTVFYTGWGLWNIFFYPYLEQWFSFFAGLTILIANVTWLRAALYYKREALCQISK